MATAEQLKALLRSYSAGDEESFYSIAMQIAAHAAHTGKERLARDLRGIIDDAKRKAGQREARILPISSPRGELSGLVQASHPEVRLSSMVLTEDTEKRLSRVIREYRKAANLRAHGLSPRRKLLLVGPPGCGKTMTASALAGELRLPLLSVQLHAVISRFMGETAAKLHLVFDAMSRTRGVYLFDEFDAIGSYRGSGNDVGEIRRVLNSFLQFLEHEESESIVIAATNLVQMLDQALFRRFDDMVRYELPTEGMIRALVENRLAAFGFKSAQTNWKQLVGVATGLSHGEIARGCDDAAKEAILADRDLVSWTSLIEALRARNTAKTRE